MKKHESLRSYLWLYLLIAAAVVIGWTALFNALDRIRDNEQLTISVYNLECDTQHLQTDLTALLPQLTQQKILYIYVDDLSLQSDDDRFNTKLTMQILQSDLVIVPESLLQDIDVTAFFPPLPQALLPEDTADCLIADGAVYAVPVCRGEIKTRMDSVCAQSEKCFLFVSAQSVNLGGYMDRGRPEDDAALAVYRYLTEVSLP